MLTKSDLKALAKLPVALQEQAKVEMIAKNKADREIRMNNPKVKAFLENRRARRQRPFGVKPNQNNTHAVINVPGFAFPISLTPEHWRVLLANQAAIGTVVATLKTREQLQAESNVASK